MLTLDALTFDRLTRKRRFQTRTLEIARRLLVHREDARDLSYAYGLSVQRIYSIARQIEKVYQSERVPDGWVEETIVAPVALMQEFKRRIAEERKRLRRDARKRAQKAGGSR